MTATAKTTTSTVLRGTLGKDGVMKLTLAAREAARLQTAASLCRTLANVPALADKAKAAYEALDSLLEDVADV